MTGNSAASKSIGEKAANLWHIPSDYLNHLEKLFAANHEADLWLLCDRNTRKHCLPLLQPLLPKSTRILCLPAGEKSKSLESAAIIWKELSKKAADRHALLLCLGGGMICDLGGFAASVYKRGIRFVLLPTSLLAMADACLGGKTGVDFEGFKNQLGTFSNPDEIILIPDFLRTLPEEDLLSGMAEISKHALCGNSAVWNDLRKAEVHRQNWPALIEASLRFKQSIVEEDPLEKGKRKVLNAGHTLGHALESFFLASGNPQPHGYCVAAGLVMEGRIALEKGLLSETELLQVEEFVYAEFGMLPLKKKDIPKVISFCRQDKKNRGGKILASLYGPAGTCSIDQEISEDEIRLALRYYLG